MGGACNVENIYTIPPDCGYMEIDPYLKWEEYELWNLWQKMMYSKDKFQSMRVVIYDY